MYFLIGKVHIYLKYTYIYSIISSKAINFDTNSEDPWSLLRLCITLASEFIKNIYKIELKKKY